MAALGPPSVGCAVFWNSRKSRRPSLSPQQLLLVIAFGKLASFTVQLFSVPVRSFLDELDLSPQERITLPVAPLVPPIAAFADFIDG